MGRKVGEEEWMDVVCVWGGGLGGGSGIRDTASCVITSVSNIKMIL